MRIILILLVAFLISTVGIAQTTDKVLARVRYTYTNKKDTLKDGKTLIENMLMFTGKNASLYTSYDLINHQLAVDQKVRAMAMKLVDDGKPKSITINESASKWMTTTNHLYYIKENKHYIKETVAYQDYLIEETTPKINWKITKETSSFSGLHCQKAISNFDGKNWIAWFSASLPFQSGPWLLNGLPGLIIEAYDEQKSVHFKFAGIENAKDGDFKRFHDITKSPNASPDLINAIDVMLGLDIASAYYTNTIKFPNFATRTTKQQLDKFKIAVEKDQKGINKAQSKYQ